ncbi:response regulator [bacterium]|jgi:DNA-binding response OmpR family regulator|nr:response regulator [bacterium]MBT4649353.1 response regulator [bacterium]
MKDKKILIIEDELSLARALSAKLIDQGCDILEAKNGEEGLSMALDQHPDLILLDIIMPRMDGISMLKKLRVDDWGKDVPVIILSNLSDGDKSIDVVDGDISAYLVKSDWKIEDIVDKIKDTLK